MLQSTGMLPKSDEISQALLGSSEQEAEENLSTFIDLLIMVEEDSDLNDPELNPDAVNLYRKLFGDGS